MRQRARCVSALDWYDTGGILNGRIGCKSLVPFCATIKSLEMFILTWSRSANVMEASLTVKCFHRSLQNFNSHATRLIIILTHTTKFTPHKSDFITIPVYQYDYSRPPPPKDSDFRRQILSLVRVLRQWNVFCMKQ